MVGHRVTIAETAAAALWQIGQSRIRARFTDAEIDALAEAKLHQPFDVRALQAVLLKLGARQIEMGRRLMAITQAAHAAGCGGDETLDAFVRRTGWQWRE